MNVRIEANRMDPDQQQEQSDLGPHCLTKSLLEHFSRQQKQVTFVVIGTLTVSNKTLFFQIDT